MSQDSSSQIVQSRLRVAVVHWLPLDQFPPAQNLLALLSKDAAFELSACTTIRPGSTQSLNLAGVNIYRGIFPAAGQSVLGRLLQFLRLFAGIFGHLRRMRPEIVVYFEPHSAPAVFLYLLWNPSARLFIHYHEYRELSHYRDRGNAIARLGHWLECRWLFRRCEWISHTNMDRVRMFLEDHPQVSPRLLRATPNYPPADWLTRAIPDQLPTAGPLRLVYVGAVSLQDTFIREVVEWVAGHGESRVTLDIYAGSTAASAKDYLLNLQSPAVRFFASGVPYQQLPQVLENYQIGLILYRGTTRNYVYNAPNKLFEYLICGLDVWYPQQMLGIRPVADELQQQQVLELDFDNPSVLDAQLLRPRRAKVREWRQTCVDALRPLRETLLETSDETDGARTIR